MLIRTMLNRTGRKATAVAALALLAPPMAGCGGEGQAGAPGAPAEAGVPSPTQDVDPDDFVSRIDNPYLPFERGTRFVYEGETDEGEERTVVEVTGRDKTILGVEITVVRDTVSRDGDVIEDTFDWYAQDRDGNVWYFGEDSKEFENGKLVSTEGSWEAGKDGARPGVVMPADPQVGDTYQQEVAPEVAEDRGEVLSLDESVEVDFGSFDNVLKTKDTTPLEPDVEEHKYYARDVGLVKEVQTRGGEDRLELVSMEQG